jgi:hypothetical protein
MISILAKTVYHIHLKKANIFRHFAYIFEIFSRKMKSCEMEFACGGQVVLGGGW